MKDQIVIYGKLIRNPELKLTNTQKAVCRFSISESVQTNGQDVWHNICAWEADAQFCHAVLKKGDNVFVQGRIKVNKWLDNLGNPRESTELTAFQIGLPRFIKN